MKNILPKISYFLVSLILFANQLNAQPCLTSGTITVGATGTYPTLTAAIAALRQSGIGGSIILELQTNYNPTSETYPLKFLQIPCASLTKTITIRPASGVTVPFVWTSAAAETISLDTASFYIIDGRAGGIGTASMLTMSNTSTTGITCMLKNGSTNNVIQYTTILGVGTSTTAGTVMFGTTNGLGNSFNKIRNCNIGDGATKPIRSIYATGTAGALNMYNQISKNNIYNFDGATTTYGINSTSNSNRWLIDSNSFYQTTNTIAANQTRIINLTGSDSNTIINNFLGGSAPFCVGTWNSATATASNAGRIVGIWVDGGTAFPTIIDNNTIQNFNLTTTSGGSAGPGVFCGIYTLSGLVKIGTTYGNLIGSMTAPNSIVGLTTLSSSVGNNYGVIGISVNSATAVEVKNNRIGSMVHTGTTATVLTRMRGIVCTGAGVHVVDSNIIGDGVPNSLSVGLTSQSVNNEVYGIVGGTTNAMIIKNNKIFNLLANSNSTTAATCVGIHIASGADSINRNYIKNLISSSNDGPRGIRLGSSGHYVIGNSIDSIIQRGGSGGNGVMGIICNSVTGGTFNTIAYNYIQNVIFESGYSGGFIIGMSINQPNTFNVYNNTIVLGYPTAITNAQNVNGIKSVALTGALNLKNNIIYVNANASLYSAVISNPAVLGTTPPSATQFNSNNNVYYINDGNTNYIYQQGLTSPPDLAYHKCASCAVTGSVFYDSLFNTPCSAYKLFLSNTSDNNSYFEMVPFTGGSTTPNNLIPNPAAGAISYAQNGGVPLGFSKDFFNVSVSASTPDVGAAEFTAGKSADNIPPTISYTDIPNLACYNTTTLSATITDVSGVNLATGKKPRLYYKKTTNSDVYGPNTTAFNGWKYVEPTNTTSPFTFNMDYSLLTGGALLPGDTIQYFVIAMDSITNTSYNSATILPTFCPSTTDLSNYFIISTSNVKKFYLSTIPIVTISHKPLITCKGDTITFNVTSGATSYSWTSNKTGATVLGTANILKYLPTDTLTIFSCNAVFSTCPFVLKDTVKVNPVPKRLKGVDSIQCGAGVPFCYVMDSNNFTTKVISWYSSDTASVALQTGSSTTYLSSISDSTSFYVSITDPLSGCKSPRIKVTERFMKSDSINAKINGIVDSIALCMGSPLSLTSTNIQLPAPTMTYNTYTWTASDTGSGINNPLTNSTGSQTITPVKPGIYTLTVTAMNSLCTSKKSIKLNALTTPTAINIAIDSIKICKGTLTKIVASGALINGVPQPKTWTPSTGLFNNSTGTIPYSTPIDSVYAGPTTNTWYYASFTHASGCKTKDSVYVSVVDTPIIVTQPPVSKRYCIGDTIKLIAKATSTDSLSRQWKKNGTNIAGNPSAFTDTLIIVTTSLADSGTYQMEYMTKNPCASRLSVACVVKMATPLSNIIQPIGFDLCTGQNGLLISSATGDSSSFWTKIGGSVTSTKDTLKITGATSLDSGWYFNTFIANSSCPVIHSDTVLVRVLPQASILTDPPALTTLCIGDSAVLRFTYKNASGFKWFKNGVEIVGATSDSLKLKPTSLADSGVYQVVVISPLGCVNDTSSFTTGVLKVKQPVVISSQTKDTTLCLNNSLKLTVNASNGVVYQWLKNGVNVTNGGSISGATTNQLTINPLTYADTATYTLLISGNPSCPILASNPIHVEALKSSLITSEPSALSNLCVGDSLKLMVIAKNTSSYSWYKKGVFLTTTLSNSYTIPKVKQSDSGTYYVICNPPAGCIGDTSAYAKVNIASPPVFLNSLPTDIGFCNGDTIKIPTTVGGTGPFQYHWYKGAIRIDTTPVYTKAGASILDNGTYKVSVTGNSACPNLVSSNIKLTVNTPPSILTQPSGTSPLCNLQILLLTASAINNASPIEWYKVGSFSIQGTGPIYTKIANVLDEGKYYVKVPAKSGCKDLYSDTFDLQVKLPAIITIQPKSAALVDSASMDYTLFIDAIGNGPFAYQWFKDSVAIPGATNTSYTIVNYTPGRDSGYYHCTVTSGAPCNNTATSNKAHITTSKCPFKIPQIIKNIKVCEGGEFSLDATVFGANSIQWFRDSNEIPGATLANYSIALAEVSQSGYYYVQITPKDTSICSIIRSDSTLVTVVGRPVIKTQPSPNRLCAALVHKMTVEAENATKYKWYKNGTPVILSNSPSHNVLSVTTTGDTFFVEVSNDQCESVFSDTVFVQRGDASSKVVLTNHDVYKLVPRCTDLLGWTYYAPNKYSDSFMIAIKTKDSFTEARPDIELLDKPRIISHLNIENRGAVLGARLYNLNFLSTIKQEYNVKFFYAQSEEDAVRAEMEKIKNKYTNRFSSTSEKRLNFINSTQVDFTKELWRNAVIPWNFFNTITYSANLLNVLFGKENGVQYAIIQSLVGTKTGGTMFMDYYISDSVSSSIANTSNQLELQAFPVPSMDGHLTLRVQGKPNQAFQLSVSDMTGRNVWAKELTQRKNLMDHPLDLSHLSNGNYMIHITMGEESKFIQINIAK